METDFKYLIFVIFGHFLTKLEPNIAKREHRKDKNAEIKGKFFFDDKVCSDGS